MENGTETSSFLVIFGVFRGPGNNKFPGCFSGVFGHRKQVRCFHRREISGKWVGNRHKALCFRTMQPVSGPSPGNFPFVETPWAVSGLRKRCKNTEETPCLPNHESPRKLLRNLKIPSSFPDRFPHPETPAVPVVRVRVTDDFGAHSLSYSNKGAQDSLPGMPRPPGSEALTGTSCTLNSLFDRPSPEVHVVHRRLVERERGRILETFKLCLHRRRLCDRLLRLRTLERDLFTEAELWFRRWRYVLVSGKWLGPLCGRLRRRP